jgi:alpha/beta superfamily hydrolase
MIEERAPHAAMYGHPMFPPITVRQLLIATATDEIELCEEALEAARKQRAKVSWSHDADIFSDDAHLFSDPCQA